MKIEIPNKCPSCESELTRIKDQLFCTSKSCPAKNSKQVENFAKVLKIKGLGAKTIEKLNLFSIVDIYQQSEDKLIEKLGLKLGTKLYQEIENSKNTNLGTFLAACSIPLIGTTAANKVAMLTNNPLTIDKELCKRAGLGDKATNNLVNWIETEYVFMDLPVSFKEIQKTAQVNNISVCITGKIKGYTKNSLTEYLNSLGISVVNSVSSKVDYLLCDELKGSSKENKAISLDIEILTLEQFKEILKNE